MNARSSNGCPKAAPPVYLKAGRVREAAVRVVVDIVDGVVVEVLVSVVVIVLVEVLVSVDVRVLVDVVVAGQ